MNPVIPSTIAPVAPPDAENPAAVGVDMPMQPINTDIHSMYEDAANSGDPASMYSLTSRVKGTPLEPVIKRSADVMAKNANEIDSEFKPVIEAGGANTPEGRIAAANTWESVADKPQKMRAFVEMLMGNPKWRTFVTGGTPTTTLGYDSSGKQLERTTDELGKTISVVDMGTRQEVSPKELQERGGFLSSLDNAIGFQSKKEITKFNTEAFNQANKATNDYAAQAPVLKDIYAEIRQRLTNLNQSDLSDEQRQAIASFTSRTMGYSQSVSEGLNALAQKVDNKNVSLSKSEQQSLGAVLDKLGFKVSADGSVRKANGEAVTKSDLTQAQNTLSNGSQFERQFTQSKADFISNKVFSNLGEAEKQSLGRIIDLQGMAEKAQMDLSKNGNLPFLINPQTYQIGHEFKRGEALALVGEFNQDAIQLFQQWRNEQLKSYKNGQVPNAGELEAAFAKTKEFAKLKSEYAEKNKDILKTTGGKPNVGETPATQWPKDVGLGETAKETPKNIRERSLTKPVAPSTSDGYTVIGKTPDGKKVYRSPEGKQVVEK